MKFYSYKILICLFVLVFNHHALCQSIEIKVINIKSEKGKICLAFFESEKEFIAEKPKHELKFAKQSLNNGYMSFFVPYHVGIVGISVLDDENEDGHMNYKLLGIPSEGFGFSNYYHKGIFKPVFKNFSFELEANEIKKVEIKMRYFNSNN